jgi:hypothetical protein
MKTAKLKNGLICVSVPINATEFYVSLTYTKYISYQKDNHNYSVELPFRNFNNYQILGTITANECSFDCEQYCEKNYTNGKTPYKLFGEERESWCSDYFNSFLSMIESETEFLFSNPIENPNPKPLAYFGAIDLKTDEIEVWGKHQDRVIEKLLILKTI